MTHALYFYLSGRYQACALNYNHYLKRLFGERLGIDRQLTYEYNSWSLLKEPPGPHLKRLTQKDCAHTLLHLMGR